jgi:hypothetical protein
MRQVTEELGYWTSRFWPDFTFPITTFTGTTFYVSGNLIACPRLAGYARRELL